MKIKIAINGFGRIGRPTFKKIIEDHPDLEVVAINDLTDNRTLAHLLKYDSLYGVYGKEIDWDEEGIIVDGKKYKVFEEKDPQKLPWRELEIDIVLESTGIFRDFQGAERHLRAGAKYVIISAPSKTPERIRSFILGVNENEFSPQRDKICDMGSCTTNCLAPVLKVLDENFKVRCGFMTTVHSYTNDQRILDLAHKDLRRGRAAALNIIPTTTGAAKAIGKVLPHLSGKLDGIAIRVPTPTVSLLDLVVEVEKLAEVDKVNEVFKRASQKELEGILKVEEEELVSTDFKKSPYSAIIDLSQTNVIEGSLIKTLAWYDNEWGYACRFAEFAEFVGKKIS